MSVQLQCTIAITATVVVLAAGLGAASVQGCPFVPRCCCVPERSGMRTDDDDVGGGGDVENLKGKRCQP